MIDGYSTLNKKTENGKSGNGKTIHQSRPVLSEGIAASKGVKALRFIRNRAEFRRAKNGISEADWKKKADARYAEALGAFNAARKEIPVGKRHEFYELVEMLCEGTKIGWKDFVRSIRVLPRYLENGFLHAIGMVEEAAVNGKAVPEPEHTSFVNPHELFKPKE